MNVSTHQAICSPVNVPTCRANVALRASRPFHVGQLDELQWRNHPAWIRASPWRASSGPSTKTDARILRTSSASQNAIRDVSTRVALPTRLGHPIRPNKESGEETSTKSGRLVKRCSPGANRGDKDGRAAFGSRRRSQRPPIRDIIFPGASVDVK